MPSYLQQQVVILRGILLVAGETRGLVLATAPLSFWGGYDPEAGRVIDRHLFAVIRTD